jgi:hypothetical protein
VTPGSAASRRPNPQFAADFRRFGHRWPNEAPVQPRERSPAHVASSLRWWRAACDGSRAPVRARRAQFRRFPRSREVLWSYAGRCAGASLPILDASRSPPVPARRRCCRDHRRGRDHGRRLSAEVGGSDGLAGRGLHRAGAVDLGVLGPVARACHRAAERRRVQLVSPAACRPLHDRGRS